MLRAFLSSALAHVCLSCAFVRVLGQLQTSRQGACPVQTVLAVLFLPRTFLWCVAYMQYMQCAVLYSMRCRPFVVLALPAWALSQTQHQSECWGQCLSVLHACAPLKTQ